MPQVWQERYAAKVEPAAAAVRRIQRGDRVFIGSACGEPQALVRAMLERSGGLADVELVQMLGLGAAPYLEPRYADTFRANAFFIGSSLRDAVNEIRADHTPIFLSQLPGLFKSGQMPLDIALIMVSPPDEHGFCSLGVSVDVTKAALESAKTVIAQVNSFMPRTLGDCNVNVERLTALVEHDELLLELPMQQPDEVALRIAAHVARLVPNGATLQLGFGGLSEAVLSELDEKNDLGIHTETFSDGIMRLARRGVITGRYKTVNPNKIVGSFAAGSSNLFLFLDNNPQIEMRPADYTNNIAVISSQRSMVAINYALEVDLTGQIAADSLGRSFYSGIGGHADFMRGAALSPGGKPIIAMPSTAPSPDGNGVRSRIVPFLQEGSGVGTTRGDAYYVVTEHGVAFLHGKNMRERAMALISVSHPDFRGELLHAAKRRRLVYADQIAPPVTRSYPAQYEEAITLGDGTPVLIRPIRPDDEGLMKDMFYSFSEQTLYLRYHSVPRSMPHNQLQLFCNVDYDTEMALIAVVGGAGQEQVVAVGWYLTDGAKSSAELAFAVQDAWQRKGLGSHLFQKLVEIAQRNGVRRLHADVLVQNAGMLKIFHRSGLHTETSTDQGVVHVIMRLPEKLSGR